MKPIMICLLILGFILSTPHGSKAAMLPQHQPISFSSHLISHYQAVNQVASPTDVVDLPTWESVALPPKVTVDSVHGLVVDPAHATVALLATTAGLYKTTDAGQTWARLGENVFGETFEVLIGRDNPQRIYARSWDLYRSDDGGANWVKVKNPTAVCGLFVAPAQADRLYGRSCPDAKQAPIVRSDDGGQSWVIPTTNLTTPLDVLAVAPNQSDLLIGATFEKVFRSTDAGVTWTPVAVGTRYASRPVFDAKPPYTLYLGHWTGLLRSLDAGVTWQDSGADREFANLIVAADASGAVLGGNPASTWQLHSDEKGWSATSWNAPLPLQGLWGSATDASVIYALSKTGLWRQQTVQMPIATTAYTAFVYLPVVQRQNASPHVTVAAAATVDQAVERANFYRAQVGAIPLRQHPLITAAAQHHVAYYLANYADASAEALGAHGEVAGKPEYTGQWPSDRLKAAGYPWTGGSEVIHFINDPVLSVDGWMATLYHRLVILDPNAHYAGYASGQRGNMSIDVLDFGAGPTDDGVWSSAMPYALAYPADGQTDVPPSWNGSESPDPLPPGVQRPVGYPFTLQGVGGKLQVDTAVLRAADGSVVPVHPNPTSCVNDGSCYALIAVAPLQPNTTYVVEASGAVGGVAFQRQWHFTTGATSVTSASTEPAP